MSGAEELWIPLVDEPIGSVVAQIQEEDPELDELVSTPRRLLAFRTFAYIRVGLLLGELLVEQDPGFADGEERNWVELLLESPEHLDAVTREVHAVAEEIAADPAYADEDDVGPDDETRQRFRDFARRELDTP
jgi:hypothetical protein